MVVEQLISRKIKDVRVLAAMRRVPRECFVPPEFRVMAYLDGVIPLGHGQTVSQPYMVARMIELLELSGTEKVLEVGAGSGYQAAVISECAQEVYSVERIPDLVELARKNLQRAGYRQATIIEGDGTRGLSAYAPYDAIIVAAGAPRVPPALTEQLAEGGKLVIPVGDRLYQRIVVARKSNGVYTETVHEGCVFVPLIGAEGW